jgi:hypothetical protein
MLLLANSQTESPATQQTDTRSGPPDTCQHYSEASRQHLKMTTAGGDAQRRASR